MALLWKGLCTIQRNLVQGLGATTMYSVLYYRFDVHLMGDRFVQVLNRRSTSGCRSCDYPSLDGVKLYSTELAQQGHLHRD